MGENNISVDQVNRWSILSWISSSKTLWKETKDNYVLIVKSLLIGILASVLIEKLLWWRSAAVIHTILELIPMAFNISLFFLVWNKYKDSPDSSKIIAFGVFATTIFDLEHTYFYGPLGFAVGKYYDLGPRFWILARTTEILGIFIASFNIKKVLGNKWACLTMAAGVPVFVSYISINFVEYIPEMFNGSQVTANKIIFESIIIILAALNLSRHRKKMNEVGYISYRYLGIALLFIIPAEICFMLYSSYDSSIMVYGHVLRIVYCYFMYRSIFQSNINYAYEELELSKRRLNEILDALPMGILTYDNNLKADFINKEYESLLSCSRKDIIGLSSSEVLEVFSKTDSLGEEPLAEKAAKGSRNMKAIARTYLNKDGNPISLQLEAVQIEGGSLFMVRDATIEQEIDNLHLQTRTILDSMQNAACICDNQGKIIDSNKSFHKLTGLVIEEVLGMNIIKLSEKLQYIKKAEVLLEQDDHSVHKQFEVAFTKKDGSKVEVIVHKSQILNLNKETIGMICVLTDISGFKEQQQRSLHQEKLALLGQMGATIVHETRNFLTTIKGCSQLIEIMAQQEKVVNYARKINTSTDEVNRILSDFLSLSKPKQAIMEEAAICDLLQSLRSTIETSSLFKGIDIEFNFKVDERYVLCDEAQMKQVILNICKNAVEAMDDTANPRMIINAGIAEDESSVYIKVSDNGKGMNKETIDKIETLFFTTKQGGTGLGLSVCYEIVKSHGGSIEVESEEGKGTTFTINIPCIEFNELEENI